MKPRQNPFLRAAMAGVSFFALTLGASAQIYWDGTLSGTNALWSTVSGWSTDPSLDAPDPSAAPGAGDVAFFSSSNVLTNQAILLNSAQSVAGLSFPSTTFNHTFNSNDATARTLSIGASGISMTDAASAGGNVTFNSTNAANVSVAAQQDWNVGANRILSINSVLSGTSAFNKTGTGTLTLNGTNTFSGTFTHSAGLLSLNNVAALGSASGTFAIAGGTIQNASTTTALVINTAKPISLTGNFGYVIPTNGNGSLNLGTGPVTLAPTAGSTITVDNGSGIIAFDGPVSGTGMGIVKTGAGTLALMGDNTYTGLTDIRQSANLRVNGPAGFANSNVFLNGGLLELGGTVVENNAIVLGTAPGQVRFRTDATAHGGFGSASGYRKVSLTSEGVPNAPIVWGVTPHFMPATSWSTNSNGIFLLNTPLSAGTIDLTNDLNFGGIDRRFSVRDGSAPSMPDAVLSGLLTNGQLSVQTGGTLFVSNPANTISGVTFVTGGGALRVPQIAGYLGTSSITLDNAMLEVGADATVSLGDGPGLVKFNTAGGGFSTYGGTRTVSVGVSGTPLTWGSGGFLSNGANLLLGGSGSDGITRFTNPIDLGTSLRNVVVQNGGSPIDSALTGILSGTGGIHLSAGSGALHLANPANTYSGVTQISSGAIVLDHLANGGSPSSMGSSPNATGNLLFTGGSIRYIGDGSTTDRLFELRANATINSAGFGPIVFSNTLANAFTSNNGTAVTRTFSLSGYSPGVNMINSGITNSTVAVNNTTAVTKLGTTTWSLGGNNNYTGNTTILAGDLILDYSGGNNPMGGNGQIIIDNSNLTLKGKASGATAAAITGFRFGNGANGITNVLTLDAPGGSSGIALALGALGGSTTTTNALTSNLIDLSSNAGNSITVAAVNNGYSAVGNVIFANATGSPANGRSNLVVRDATGYGFAALSGTLPTATLTRLNNATTTALSATNTGNTNHYRLSYADMTPDSGDVPNGRKLTRTAALVYSTLAIEATGGPVHLDLATQAFGDSNSNNGRGILISGDQDVKFTGTGTTSYSPFFYHYGTGKFEFNLTIPNGFSVIAGGNGLYDYTGTTGVNDTRFYISGPVFRFSSANDFSTLTGGGFWVGNDGIIEIANDLNGAAAGDFSNSFGNGNGQIRLTGDSGFSAYGGNRTANFGGAGAQLVWGSNYFLTQAANGDGDVSFRLSSSKSDSTIEIVNPINLAGRDRVFDVANGSAVVDAILSGEISGAYTGIYKRGAGTLVLDGSNTYSGVTSVETGTLRLTKASLADSSTVRISSGAKLDLAHGQTDTVAALIVNGTPVAPNIYGAADLPLYLSGSGKLNVGGVAGGTTPYDDWVTANSLPSDKDLPEEDADDDGLRNLLEYSVGSNPSQPSGSVLAKAPGNTGAVQFSRAPGRTDITTVVETSTDLSLNSWTIVATSTAGAAYVSNDANVVVTDSNNPSANSSVSVTDNRTPIPTKRFYRLRVTK